MSKNKARTQDTPPPAPAPPPDAPSVESKEEFFDHQSGAFFRRVDWSAFWTAFLVSLAAYVYTLAPTVTLEDSGELAVASDYLGVPHPPGYPIWTLLSWFFQWIFHFVTYYGQPNPAWSVGLMSAFFGALACGTLALLVSRSGADMLRGMKQVTDALGLSTETLLCWTGGVASGLLLAFSPVLWSQSVIVEVYSLNAFFLVIILLLTYRWMCRPKDDQVLYVTAFVFGLGLTNHQTLLFVAVALLAAIWFRDRALFRDCLAVLFIAVGGFLLWKASTAIGGENPNPEAVRSARMTELLAFLFLVAPIGLFLIERKLMTEWKRVLLVIACTALGLSFYAYMPFASEQNPPMNWGYPRTMEGFKHAISRGQYEKVTLSNIFGNPKLFMEQLGSYFYDLRGQFSAPIALIGIFPFFFIGKLNRRMREWFITTLWAFVSLSIVLVIFLNPKLDIQTLFIQRVQLIQSHAVYALWLGYGLIAGLTLAEVLFLRFRWFRIAGIAGLALGPVALGLIIATTGGLQGGGTVMEHLQAQPLAYLAWFALIAALLAGEWLLAQKRGTHVTGIALAALLPLVLIWKNGFDEEQITVVGGAEQNGHDFGWQFGNWQLCGAQAILQEISEEERAAYPNPDYPPEMETNAIFFGGTDPGRFVPTYMIYSAKVRSDVYLITQNALADNTYMSVMRDLYGDTIWIPSQQDSNYAFQQYVQDVQAGRIPAGAAVSFQDGRVSVQGVQGVMMINGILARMIFEANKHKHAFYVEESYVIPWMYPYLEPHGLIMKINSEPMPSLTPEMVKNDRDFWDWYTRRLMGSSRFTRDVVARKTFSKLRSAIAGLYAARRMFDEAEHAFKQAIDLYPLSPEANFRLADVYMQLRRFADARVIIEEFLKQDPGNDKVGEFLTQIRNTESADTRRRELEQLFAQQQATIEHAFELADLYLKLNLVPHFEQLTRRIVDDENLPPELLLRVGQMYANAHRYDLLVVALQKYVKREPANPRIWIDLAAAQIQIQQTNEAMASLKQAIALGGEPVRDIARNDRRFDAVRQNPQFAALVPTLQANFPLPLPGM
ncbi:MAG: DUF2723 domain-containing protein [Kiritimatiellae bacterium]|nr:DUF2723 domain-containing protein [Kiritimatiellia bacterium]